MLSSIALGIGYLVLLRVAVGIVLFVHRYFLAGATNLKRYGNWAIVTGCTDGIGEAIATEFAKKGMNLVLVSRSLDKLNTQAAKLQEQYKVSCKVVAVDFSNSNADLLDGVKEAINGLDVGVLVNNVGVAYDHAEYFHLLEKSKIEQLINVNVKGTVMMTHLVLPAMLNKKKGCIINVSSASSLVSEPLYAVYSGTKAFVNNFSEALYHEYKSQGIHVQAEIPALVTSKLSKVRRPNFFIPNPASYAKAVVKQIGTTDIGFSYWTHALQFAIGLSLPRSLALGFLLNRAKGIRALAYKKKEKPQ